MGGRGFGKSFTVCRWAITEAESKPKSRGAIVAATAADARDVLVEGDSGILSFYPDGGGPIYESSKRRVTWPNGSTATLFSADEPRRLRGPQYHWAICDELAHWRYMATWDMLQFGLRLGDNPRVAVATTPLPVAVVRELIADPTVAITRGTTYDNRANLAAPFFDQIIKKYEGTRLGRQELNAELLEDVPGALWSRDMLDSTRVTEVPDLYRVVVAVDPAASSGQTGIIVAGAAKHDTPPEDTDDVEVSHGYTLADETLPAGASPDQWGRAVVAAYHKHKADVIVAETNHGGEMVEHVIRTVPGGLQVPYKGIRATRGKYVRAQPIAAVFEQARGHQVGFFPDLEDELCTYVPGNESPNRLDALVWAYTELNLSYESDLVVWG